MKKLFIALLMLTLTGCSAAQAKDGPVTPPVTESKQTDGSVATDTAEPKPEEPSKAVEPISEPVIGESAQTVQPVTEQPKQPEPVQSKPAAKPVTPPQPAKTEPAPVTQPKQQSQQIDLTGWVEYHTDDIKTLSRYLNEGLVIIHNDKYYASPELQVMLANAETVYENDVSEGESNQERGLDPDTDYEIVE